MPHAVERRGELRGGAPLVAVMQATESRQADDCGRSIGTRLHRARGRRRLAKSEVRAVLVVEGDEFSKEPLQVALVEHDDMVEELTMYTADPVPNPNVCGTRPCGSFATDACGNVYECTRCPAGRICDGGMCILPL